MSHFIRKRSSAVAAWTRLVRIHQRITAESEARFRALHLNTAWFDVLAQVGAHEGLCQGDLASALLVTKGNVSQLMTKMETEGLLERRADGRSQRVYLTPKGRALHDVAVPQQEAYLEETLRGLDPNEQTALRTLLRRWEATWN